MKGKILFSIAVAVTASGIIWADTFGTGANQFTIDFVNISSATNPASGYGIVKYDYRIGVYEITNDQWNKFRAELGVPVTGSPSSAYAYDPLYTSTNVPTNMVSWYEAAQFVNWLNTSNGYHAAYYFYGTQGTGDYSLWHWSGQGWDLDPDNLGWGHIDVHRHKDAHYFLPTVDEWVKAAYWNGTNLQTYSNASEADLIFGLPDPAKWNYYLSATPEPWAVGSGVEELNGTYDMMGNVWEWTEYLNSMWITPEVIVRPVRGGGSYDDPVCLESSSGYNLDMFSEYSLLGFRVASIPEPATLSLLALGAILAGRRRKYRIC